MSIQTELTRIINAKTAIKTAIEGKGVTVPDGTLLDGMASLIDSIEAVGGGGGGGVSGNGEWASGTYTPSETKTIGTSDLSAIKIDTGLSDIRFFAIIIDSTISTNYAYEFIMAAWDYNNGDYYGFRLAHGSKASISSIYAGKALNNQYLGNTMFSDGGIMSIAGVTTSTKVTAGNTFTWFAIGR